MASGNYFVRFPPGERNGEAGDDTEHPYRLYGKVEENFGAVTLTVEKVEYL